MTSRTILGIAREAGFKEYKGAIEVSVIFHEGQRMFAVPKQPAQQEPVAEVLRGWKLNHAQQESEGNPGMWDVGHLNEDDVFSPVITINTGLYYQDADAEPMARAVLAAITSPPAQRTWVGLEKSDMPDGADPLFDDPKFIAGMVYAANKLMEKNT